MITITLEKIRSCDPCIEGWKKILESKGGSNSDMSLEFPLTDVLTSNGLEDTLWCLRCLPEHSNLWRKYAVWCAIQVQSLITDQRSLDALDIAWKHSDGLATDDELASAGDSAWAAAWASAGDSAWAAARAAAWASAGDSAGAAAWDAAGAAAWASAGDSAWDAQKEKLIEILNDGELVA
jgi:hypothetical protein